jgi:hypothetical protein
MVAVVTDKGYRMLCWWGIWILCLSPTTNGDVPGLPEAAKAAQRGSIVSPVFTTLYALSQAIAHD